MLNINILLIFYSLYIVNLSFIFYTHIEGAIKTKFSQNPAGNVIYKSEQKQMFPVELT